MTHLELAIDGALARVRFTGAGPQNRLTVQAMEEWLAVAERLSVEAEVSAIVVHADGPFCAGMDLDDPRAAELAGMTPAQQRQALTLGPRMCRAWEEIEAYTILAIEGYCIGGGLALALAMDHRILGAGAHLRLPEVGIGMNMSWQAIPRLVAQVGPARAKQVIVTAQKVSAERALAWGLCEEVVEDGRALEAALALAGQVARQPLLPVRMSKAAVNACAQALAHATSFMDRDQYLLTALLRARA